MPRTVGGVTLQVSEFGGAEFAASGAVPDQMKSLLTSIGREPKDLSVAIAYDPSTKEDLSITAFRIRDTAVGTFLTGYLPLLTEAYGNGSITRGTRAGKDIYTVIAQSGTPPQVLVPRDDVLFVVTGSNGGLVEEALGLLP